MYSPIQIQTLITKLQSNMAANLDTSRAVHGSPDAPDATGDIQEHLRPIFSPQSATATAPEPSQANNPGPSDHDNLQDDDAVLDDIDLSGVISNAFAMAQDVETSEFAPQIPTQVEENSDFHKSQHVNNPETTDTTTKTTHPADQIATEHTPDVFNTFEKQSEHQREPPAQQYDQSNHELNQSHLASPRHDPRSPDLDHEEAELDLGAVIGDAFKSITTGNVNPVDSVAVAEVDIPGSEITSQETSKTTQSVESDPKPSNPPVYSTQPEQDTINKDTISTASKEDIDADDLALEQAIGNVFSELTREQDVPNVDQGQEQAHEDNLDKSIPVEKSDNEENIDAELEAAIGSAFQTVVQGNEVKSVEPDNHPEVEREMTHEDEDLDLHEAISASFKDVLSRNENQPVNVPESSSSVSSSTDRRGSISAALAGALASEGIGASAISEDALQELAVQITSQVQGETRKKTGHIGEMPQIDENIFEHFQNQAYNEETGKNDTEANQKLQNAIASVVRNAIHQQDQENDAQVDEIADLELLRMNEILQNALNMASENPQDLLSNLDLEDVLSGTTATDSSTSNAVVAALSRLSQPLPSSTTAFLESLRRSQDIDMSSPDGERKKSLLIAETLALHRLSMSGSSSRDYLQIELLDQVLKNKDQPVLANDQINARISNALLSLSSHINSNNTSGEILKVIKQMTNSLLNGKGYTLTSGPPTAHDIIKSYKDKNSLEDITGSLKVARNFLGGHNNDLDRKAVPIIDNVLKLFDQYSKSTDNSLPISSQEHQHASDDMDLAITSVRDLVLLSISNFTNSRYWKFSLFLGDKPKTDTPEYKERIRIENRERKKKWREENSERNKDNDLRARLAKRATSIYGESDSPDKKMWLEHEYQVRRAKRVAKQKKDEEEKKNFFASSGQNVVASNDLASNATLRKLLTDIFSLIDTTTPNSDPEIALAATSVATAAAATTFAKSIGASLQEIGVAVSHIVSSIMDRTPSMGLKDRLLNLLKGLLSVFKAKSDSQASPSNQNGIPGPSNAVLTEGANISTIGLTPRSLASTTNKFGEKRQPLDFLTSQLKRRSPGANIESRSVLKLPLFKKPQPITSKPMKSPFLSHKLPVDSASSLTLGEEAKSEVDPGLKKPLGFQRPSFSKPGVRKSTLVPPLYPGSRINNV